MNNSQSISTNGRRSDTTGKDTTVRYDPPELNSGTVWNALSRTPGVGVCVMDIDGRLLFINETSTALFIDDDVIDYHGKLISEFQPKAYVEERLVMIKKVIEEDAPIIIRHFFHGRRIESKLWPVRDRKPRCNRVIVVTHPCGGSELDLPDDETCQVIETKYVDLGEFSVLTNRELEVLALLGHGLSVPKTAKILNRSPKTIERHKSSIGKKLNLSSQAEMVNIVTRVGLDFGDTKLERLR